MEVREREEELKRGKSGSKEEGRRSGREEMEWNKGNGRSGREIVEGKKWKGRSGREGGKGKE